MANKQEDPAVTNFREYLRIPSVHPDVDYDACVSFLKKQSESLGLSYKIYYAVPKKPIFVMTWEGKEPKLPTILLNSHMDVVPVFPEKWIHPPFAAEKDENGNIYARGAQDMKCVGIQYLEAIRRLKKNGIQLLRTVHLSFNPDEEIGGRDGLAKFVHMQEFRDLNVGFALDEGMASTGDHFILFPGERSIWQIHVHCPGQPGHGSLLPSNTAGEKLRVVIDKFMDFRQREKSRLESNSNLKIGDVTTINLTVVKGGVQTNVIPAEMVACFDVRLACDVDHDKFENMIKSWCAEAGSDVRIEFEQKNPKIEVTKTDDSSPWWVAFKRECDAMGLKLSKEIFPGGTDGRYIRYVGIPAFGFSPMNNTPVLLHDNDEFLNESIFLRGIEIYCKLIPGVANVAA
ncbi:aminoacylase-1 isoform X1 [Frankliniella occidentalis]|uniref:N-acyl-aliphatic-L-amino acid amidohydrolase n=1 Tax=Frankliniella occidentalis TaxID=133901 RepID=A0A6J1TBK8_FRAOC|nr:aminoacylase-1 isoform X1 [Frankliniella occidentalis]XP_026290178.1 aminoacylase-1 isoform X1 [Frankliniella occidentalis]